MSRGQSKASAGEDGGPGLATDEDLEQVMGGGSARQAGAHTQGGAEESGPRPQDRQHASRQQDRQHVQREAA